MPKPRKSSKEKQDQAPSLHPDAMRAMAERMLAGVGSDRRTPEQQAQELAYEAMETPVGDRYFQLITRALELDRENVDALLMAVFASEYSVDKRIEWLRHIVGIAEKKLGKEAFKEYVPHFWGFIETRPYMRARERLAGELHAAGRLEEAIQEYSGMMALNENDNQGSRYILLPSYLALGRLEEARALMRHHEYDCESNVIFSWGQVLERLLSKDEPGALKALAVARKQNPHMEVYLKKHRKLPKNRPASYAPGTLEEAQCYAVILLSAWEPHPDAIAWLSWQSKQA
jgi:tetratricopeptide (TPR) repeat protein